MQKSFIAIALALSLTCAFAYYAPIQGGYVQTPLLVAQDSENNFTNSTNLQLASVNIGELDLLASNVSANQNNASANTFNAIYRKLNGKTLAASTNTTVTFTAPLYVSYINGYALAFAAENGTGLWQVYAYQSPVNGGAALPRVTVTSNNNTLYTPQLASASIIGKTVYVFYVATNTSNQINVTNFVVGGAAGSLEFNLTTTFNGSLSVAWGEALGSNQLFVSWLDGPTYVLKDALVDVSKGTVTVNTVGNYNSNQTCATFSTDKKWYGDLCYDRKTVAGTTTFFVRSNTTSLLQINQNFTNTSTLAAAFPYGQYLAVIFADSTLTANNQTWGYELWNLDTFTTFKNRTNFLTVDSASTANLFRVTSGGLYTLTYNNQQVVNGSLTTVTSVQVGLVLGSSYLTSVFALLAIVAGLLLF